MKFFRKSKGFFILYALIFIITLKLINNYGRSTIVIDIPTHETTNRKYCPIPVFKDSIHDFKDSVLFENLKCPYSLDLVSINNGNVIISKNQYCTYQCIYWNSDFNYKLSTKEILNNLTQVPCLYFYVTCQQNQTEQIRSQLIMTGIRNDTLIRQSLSLLKGLKKPRDVLVLGIDSMSYNSYKGYLPKIFSVLHNDLNGVSFTKFNTMGDGTTVNLQGLLTGTRDTETYEARRRISGAKTVDNYNWIWKDFKKHGYLTQYYEEMTDYGTFQYRLLGFETQPTDMYLRTFLMYAERNKISKNYCLQNKPQHSEILRFYNEVLQSNIEVPTFSFIFFSQTSHDDNKYVRYLDGDISQFLLDLRKSNPNMLIILYADHGHRFNSRLSMQGKYEERLPFLGISLPKDLSHLKPILKSNSEILVSGLDVHATLEDVLGIYKPQIRNRHMSLLRPLPEDRSCSDIESAAHWCACLNWNEISNPHLDKRLLSIADAVSRQITSFTSEERDLCAELKTDRIISLHKMNANAEVLKFKKSADIDGFIPDLSDETEKSHIWFKLVLKTKPGDAIFEVTVSVKFNDFNSKETDIKVDQLLPNDVSRINRYAPWIKCLTNISSRVSKVSDVRKFCICKTAV